MVKNIIRFVIFLTGCNGFVINTPYFLSKNDKKQKKSYKFVIFLVIVFSPCYYKGGSGGQPLEQKINLYKGVFTMKNTTENILFSLGMKKTSINSIDSFESFLIERKESLKHFSEQDISADYIITITDGENIVITESVRFIDIDTTTGYGFKVTYPSGKVNKFTYNNSYNVYMKSRVYSNLWD